MKKNKYNFSNGFVFISNKFSSFGLEKYTDKLFFTVKYDDGEIINIYTAKKYERCEELDKYTCECGNLTNSLHKDYEEVDVYIVSKYVCSFCLGFERVFKMKPRISRLQMKLIKYKGKNIKKWKKELKKYEKKVKWVYRDGFLCSCD